MNETFSNKSIYRDWYITKMVYVFLLHFNLSKAYKCT